MLYPYLLRAMLCLLLLVSLLTCPAAQNKNDFIWLLGTPPNEGISDPYYGGDHIDFATGNPAIEYIELSLDMWYPDIMSDEEGHLSFYTNGCEIRNADHELIENGGEINAGFIHNTYCNDPPAWGYPWYQGHVTLPYPGRVGEYVLFHTWVNEQYMTMAIYYTHIDMNANEGQGKVPLKNAWLWQDTLSRALTATRHANGRDWWLIAARDNSSKYYVFRLDPTGVHGPFIQQPDAGWIPGHLAALSNIFSPNGSKYVRVGGDVPADFRMYDFDRCSGTFSNPVTIHLPDTITYAPWACFSPNSRYLYVQNNGLWLYQYDTWAADINASRILIGEYDGFLGRHDLPTSFNSMLTGPDQRIYMSCRSGTNYLHTIHKPNEPGLACDFRQHDVVLPAHFPFYLPNMPYYRLYNLPSSPCDTLGVQPPMVAFWRNGQDSLAGPTVVDFTDISYFQPLSWYWSFGDGAFSTEQSPTHTYAAAGIYEVCLIACNAQGICDTLCKEVNVKFMSGTKTLLDGSMTITLSPNPASSELSLEFSETSESGACTVRIFNMAGMLVKEQQVPAGQAQVGISLSGLPSGLYALTASFAEGIWSAKFVKGPD